MEVKYISETHEFIVDGQVIKEDTLTLEEIKKLKKKCKNLTFLIGEKIQDNSKLIV